MPGRKIKTWQIALLIVVVIAGGTFATYAILGAVLGPPDTITPPAGYTLTGYASVTAYNVSEEEAIDITVHLFYAENETLWKTVDSGEVFHVTDDAGVLYWINETGFCYDCNFVNCSSATTGKDNVVYLKTSIALDDAAIHYNLEYVNGEFAGDVSDFEENTTIQLGIVSTDTYELGEASQHSIYTPNGTLVEGGIAIENGIKRTSIYIAIDCLVDNLTVNDDLLAPMWYVETGGANWTICRYDAVINMISAEGGISITIEYTISTTELAKLSEIRIIGPFIDDFNSPLETFT